MSCILTIDWWSPYKLKIVLQSGREVHKEKEMKVETDDPQFIKFLKYGIRRNYTEWFPTGRIGKKL